MSSYTGEMRPVQSNAWRTRDIVVTAVIAVAFGVVFAALNAAWPFLEWAGPARYALYGIWLLPAIVAPLIIRKPGAALFAEMVAASLSLLIVNQWGPSVLLSGFVQGLAAELVFAATRYRLWSWPVLIAASLASTAAAWIHDRIFFFPTASMDFMATIGVFMAISAVVLMPLAAVGLVRALRNAGVLEGFPA
jgi:energy-coupling factor transport system substrate-specific component